MRQGVLPGNQYMRLVSRFRSGQVLGREGGREGIRGEGACRWETEGREESGKRR